MNLHISSFEQDVLYTHWTYYAIPFCKYNIVLIVARAQYNICICLEHKSAFMHQPSPAFPFEFSAVSMNASIAPQSAANAKKLCSVSRSASRSVHGLK